MMSSTASSSPQPQIPRFYAGRSVFITGSTGFMGKVLVERLLSTCPDIGRLYLLMRTKKEIAPEKRIQVLRDSQIFDNIRHSNPLQLDKLVLVPGDVAEPQLGISTEAITMMHEVSIVFHSAATLKFNEELRKAVDQNVRSAIRIMDICDMLPNVQAYIHVSSAYSNADLDYIEERVYPAPVPVDQLLALVDFTPPHLMTEITAKYIAPKPNTYTFTKAIAENAVEEHRNRSYSIAIFRPTIVVSALKHPYPGWIENLNGPSGVAVAAGKGLLHVFPAKFSARADMLPVDICIDSLIAVAWETTIDKSQQVRVYNCSTYDNPTTWGAFRVAVWKILSTEYPLDKAKWYPFGHTTDNKHVAEVLRVLLQTVPTYLAEYASRLLCFKNKLSLITANNRISSMSNVLKFFSLKEFRFETSNLRRLRARLSPADASIYNLDVGSINWEEQNRNFMMGTRKYLLGEKDQDLAEAKKHVRRMWYLHITVSTCFLLIFIRMLLVIPFVKDFVYGAVRLMLSLFSPYNSTAVLDNLL